VACLAESIGFDSSDLFAYELESLVIANLASPAPPNDMAKDEICDGVERRNTQAFVATTMFIILNFAQLKEFGVQIVEVVTTVLPDWIFPHVAMAKNAEVER